MIRFLFLLHRYLGIVVGLVMLIWTLSGIIMMYREYPELSAVDQLAMLNELDTTACCELPDSPLLESEQFTGARVEMLLDKPVLRLNSSDRGLLVYDLSNGMRMASVDEGQAQVIADRFVRDRYAVDSPRLVGRIHTDQWTVYGAYNPLRPLFKYEVGDDAGTQFYVSGQTGEIVQLTTSSQRVWGYLGAVIHWLYPTALRQHTALWAQVVIWLTILGIFLTATGLYIGIRQYRLRSSGRLSPYRGMALYHHYAGLVFGVFTLTWVGSGLLSMNPWGALEGEGAGPEVRRLMQRPVQWSDIAETVNALDATAVAAAVRLEIDVLQGETQVIAHGAQGIARRLDAGTLSPAPLADGDLSALANLLQPGSRISSQSLITQSDAYYYDHHVVLEFPVYRVVFDDDQHRHYYLSPVSGQLQRKIDSELRLYRWLFYGLHRGDFSGLLRSRPVWDILMLGFLSGVTLVCATGSYMAIRRLRRDLALKKFKTAGVVGFNKGIKDH